MPSNTDDNDAPPVASTSIGSTAAGSATQDQIRGNLGHVNSEVRQQRRRRRQNAAETSSSYRAPFFASAAQPEIIRANQKDLYYLTQLTDQLEEVARSIFGTRWLQMFANEVGLASRMAYFGLTTLLGTQTLGEEYVDILQFDSRTRKIPTLAKRALLLSSHILAPYFLAKLYTRLKRYILDLRARNASSSRSFDNADAISLNDSTTTDPLFSDEPAASSNVAEAAVPSTAVQTRLPLASLLNGERFSLPTFESLMDEHVRAVHLAVFYLFGRYYHVAKRLLGIRYLSLQMRLEPGQPGSARPPSYEVLGVLMVVQMAVRLGSSLIRRRRERAAAIEASTAKTEDEKEKRPIATVDGRSVADLAFDPDDPAPDADEDAEYEPSEARRCTLCLGPRRDPASTECGHCFCYTCIVAWAREKAECPLCRSKVKLSKILPLYGF